MRLNKFFKLLVVFVTLIGICFCTSCKNDKVISVCASRLPHADVLENCVADILEKQGYTLEVTVLNWTLQNSSVAMGDYDANYFQHIPFLEDYNGKTKLFPVCKVHYEPLGIYRGSFNGDLKDGKNFAICNDSSNAARALELLYDNGVIPYVPVNQDNQLTIDSTHTFSNGVTVTLLAEELLVVSMLDYDFACLPCNTAYSGNVDPAKKVAEENSIELVNGKANILAARLDDYNNDAKYKAKIDALADALLSEEVRNYILNKYSGAIACNEYTQVDLREN